MLVIHCIHYYSPRKLLIELKYAQSHANPKNAKQMQHLASLQREYKQFLAV